MAISTVYLITGVSRGIGLAIVKELCARYSDIRIVGCVRDPTNTPLLDAVVQQYPGVIDVVKYEAGNTDNNKEIAQSVLAKYGRVDTLIANAGIFTYNGHAADTPVDTLREHLEVNAIAPLVLFQAFVPCLKASSDPKYIPISTAGASSAYIQMPIGQGCYGGSKVILNFITRKIHFENEWLTSFPLSPGCIDTDMSRGSLQRDITGTMAKKFEEIVTKPDQGGRMLVDIILASKRETHGGEFVDLDGSKLPW
ncbi:hypothetical protein D9619_009653 [Psilocybe cf. subviscida]|uniref:Uncharacterized protein n=1 Tax=Psilocybe cf. subviscida TaxID=2480587 RepID=A0A8H5BLJ6_9AGAR|nr:hypothetical protein D9619_009653 [Psilocybe cf. subviscida]